MQRHTLMVQGTTSDAGKSTIVAGLGRLLQRRGNRVVPFKPQNMALNSAVTADGGEIGRAQAVQADACRVPTSVHMNPILIKPSSDTGAQVIVQGKALGNFEAGSFHDYKPKAMAAVLDSYQTLLQSHECVLVEGAGSPAEINLREGDIANMGFAEAVDCPVVLVTDIDRGGSFAHLVGTLELLSDSEQQRIKGFFINRFRGDLALLQPGIDWLEERTGIPVLGVIPWIPKFYLEAEDAIDTEQVAGETKMTVCVPVFPRISNHTDFDPMRLHPDIDLRFIAPGSAIPPCDLIVLPGSKAVRQDLEYLRSVAWDKAIDRHLRYGGKVMGICGGFQMLGRLIDDPDGVEGEPGKIDGLNLIDCTTVLTQSKALRNVNGFLCADESAVTGYEIHMGVSQSSAELAPFAMLIDSAGQQRAEGVCSDDDQIRATYLHGVFDHPQALASLIRWAGLELDSEVPDFRAVRERELDRLADTLEAHVDLDRLTAFYEVKL